MSTGAMTKAEFPELPDDISQRLDELLTRVMSKATDEMRAELRKMIRFSNLSEVAAARIVLTESEHPMPVSEILEALKAGGIWRPPSGSKGSDADTEMLRALSKSANAGVNLKYVDKEKDIIGLPEWGEGQK